MGTLMDKNSKPLLTVGDVAEMLGLSVGGVYRLVSQKRIPVTKLSARCIRFRRSDLDVWIQSLTQASKDQKIR